MNRAARMRPGPTQDLLLKAALQPDADRAAEAAAEWSAQADLDTLDFGSLLLLPQLANRAEPVIDDAELDAQIAKVARFSWLRTELLSRQVAPALGSFVDAGIEPVLIKGAALVHAHGAPARLRPMFDVDVLVSREEVFEASRLLVAAGFRSELDAALTRGDEHALSFEHSAAFRHENGAEIDLHWSAMHAMRRPEVTESLRERSVPASVLGTQLRALSAEDALVVAVAHGMPWAGNSGVRWVGDAVHLLHKYDDLDWDRIVGNARDWRMSPQLLDALDYLGEVAGIATPPGARRELSRAPVPMATRLRRRQAGEDDGGPVPSGRLLRVVEAYEDDVSSSVPPGTRTGPIDFAWYLQRRWELPSITAVPRELAFVAAGRPWRTRRALRLRRPDDDARNWPPYALGSELHFDGREQGQADGVPHLVSNWWIPEGWGVWSRGTTSRLRLGFDTAPARDMRLDFTINGPLNERREEMSFDVVVNEHRFATIPFTRAHDIVTTGFDVPADVFAGRAGAEITFVVHDPAIPAELRINGDTRELGIALRSLTLRTLSPNDETPPDGGVSK
jgi:hypothetical protein